MIGWRRRQAVSPPVPVDQPDIGDPATEAATGHRYEISSKLVVVSKPNSAASGAFHRTANELIHRHLALGRRGLAVCGASSGTGVTFTAANLAVALGQAGVSTLLIEANMRSPGLEGLVRPLRASDGLQQLLRSQVERSDVIHHDALTNLSLLYAGGVAGDADELLAQARFRQVLRDCMRDYDCTIVDTPAANRSAEARMIAVALGHAVIVGRRSFTFLDDTLLLSQQLAQDGVTVVGSIFNGA